MASRPTLGRITRDEEFRRVYRHGARRGARLVILHHLPNTANAVRLGVAVGRQFGGAVARNRLRRRLREAVRVSVADIERGVDVIVVPREAASRADYSALRAEVLAVLAAEGLLVAPGGGRR
jgi:ribonuclease P protein component